MQELAVGEYATLAEGLYLEGLSYDFGRDVVWYSDVVKGGIHGVKPDGTPFGAFNEDRMWTGGVMMNSCGAVLSSGQGGIMWNNPDTGKSGWLLQEIDGEPINGVNEMWPDGEGGIFFGGLDIENIIAGKATRPVSLYRLTADRRVLTLDADIYFANGVAYDADRRRFYCSDTFRTSWTWDVADDLSLTNQCELLKKTDCDGLALEADGTVLITGVYSPGKILRVTPDGEELAPLLTPEGATTQIRFGGQDLRDTYLVVVPADAGDALKEGRMPSGVSQLYRGRAEKPGVGVGTSNFKLG